MGGTFRLARRKWGGILAGNEVLSVVEEEVDEGDGSREGKGDPREWEDGGIVPA